MARKGENIYKRKDGRWEARYEKGRNARGTIIYGSLYGKSYREVKEKRNRILLEYQKMEEPAVSGCKIRSICYKWLETVRYTVKDSTYSCYVTLVHKHIIPHFGNYSIITSDDIQQFIYFKVSCGLAPASVRSIVILLDRILTYGEDQELLPVLKRKIVFPKNLHVSKDILDMEQLNVLARYLYHEQANFELGVLLCMHTGIRIGELCGLRWEDFDLKSGVFEIRRSVSRIRKVDDKGNIAKGDAGTKTMVIVSSPKSASSVRQIPLPQHLTGYIKRQYTEKEHYVLTGTTACMEPRKVQRKFEMILKKCDLPHVTFHSLRHSFASRCIEDGVDSKALSEILGHASVKITMDIYVHSNMEQKKRYMNRIII